MLVSLAILYTTEATFSDWVNCKLGHGNKMMIMPMKIVRILDWTLKVLLDKTVKEQGSENLCYNLTFWSFVLHNL